MRAGRMDTRLAAYKPTQTQGADGGSVTSWSLVKTVWAQFWAISGSEASVAGAKRAESTHEAKIRYRALPDLDETWHFRLGARRFDITAVLKADQRERDWRTAKAPRRGVMAPISEMLEAIRDSVSRDG